MSNELQNILNDILQDKNANLKPENLRQAISCLGVEGTFTSDANALPKDILSGKYAYVGGNKVEGSIVTNTKPLGATSLKVTNNLTDNKLIAFNDDGICIKINSENTASIYKYDFEHSSLNFITEIDGTGFDLDTISISNCYETSDGWYLLIATSKRTGRISGSDNYVYVNSLIYTESTDSYKFGGYYHTTAVTYMCSPTFHENSDGNLYMLIPNYGDSSSGYSYTYLKLIVYRVNFDINDYSIDFVSTYSNSDLAKKEYHLTMSKFIISCTVSDLDDGSHLINIMYGTTWTGDTYFGLTMYASKDFSNITNINSIRFGTVYKDLRIDGDYANMSDGRHLIEFTIHKYLNSSFSTLQEYSFDISSYFGNKYIEYVGLNTADNMIIAKVLFNDDTSALCSFLINDNEITFGNAWSDFYNSTKRYMTNSESSNRLVPFIIGNVVLFELKTDGVIIESLNDGDYTYYNTYNADNSSSSILEETTFYGLNGKITGTMKNNGDVTIAPTTSEQVKEQGYYNSLKVSAVTSAIDSNIIPENIKKDVSILGVTGSLQASGGSDVTPIYQTTEYTVKDISVDLNEVVDSISTYEQYVVIHTTLNKLKVYNKSNLTEPLMSLDDVSLPYQQFMYIFDKVDNRLYISFGDDGTAEQGYWIADLTSNNITKGTYTNTLDSTQDNDIHIDRLNHLVHYKRGRNRNYFYIYSYDAIQGFTQLADVYNHFGSYIGNNVYENNKNITIINNTGSYSDYNVVPSSMNYDVSGLNYTKTKAFVYSYDDYKSVYVYSLNDDYSLNELLNTIELSFEFTDGRPIFECLNSNYYYLSYNENNYILKFDEETNQFSIVLTNQNLKVRNSLPYIENQNQYIDFQQGDTEIGILYNGNQYLTRDKYTGYTNSTLLSGNTMYDIAHQIVAGTMTNNGDVVITPTTQEQTKEQGYYNSLKVSGVTSDIDSNIVPENIKKDISILGVTGTLEESTGTDTSDGTAVASDIALNKTAYVNGEKVTGTLPIESNVFAKKAYNSQDEKQYNQIRFFANNDTKTIVDKDIMVQVYTDYAELAETLQLTADKIKKGETILGITGTYEGIVSQEEYEQAVDTTEQILGINNTEE